MNSRQAARLNYEHIGPDSLIIQLAGEWTYAWPLPGHQETEDALGQEKITRLGFDATDLSAWDSSLLPFLSSIFDLASALKIQVDKGGLPEGVRRLLDLARAVPERAGAARQKARQPMLASLGDWALFSLQSGREALGFLGDLCLAWVRMITGRARFRRIDFLLTIQACGVGALPIVALISLLFGLILAFMGAVQLRMFGAQIYVASLVGIAMVRVMGAVLTGIIMAGRTGAAFAAELGTMQVNEEIDALKTLGISPMEYLVLPRMLALVLMMPLLCIFSNIMGIAGGYLVGVLMLDLNPMEYFITTREAVSLTNFWIGLVHSLVFATLIALAGCYQGIHSGRSASAVGDAATAAVVTSIVAIIVATSVITVVCQVIGV